MPLSYEKKNQEFLNFCCRGRGIEKDCVWVVASVAVEARTLALRAMTTISLSDAGGLCCSFLQRQLSKPTYQHK
jgi:hypothetical protein